MNVTPYPGTTASHRTDIDETTQIDADAEFRGIVDELTRRGFLGGLAGTAGLLGLAACTSSAGNDAASSSAAATTRTVTTATGPVVVPVHPARVV